MTEPKRRFSADSLVKIILIAALAGSLVLLTLTTLYRAVTREDIDSQIMLDIFSQFIGLFGVVVGYVLGSKSNKD